MKRLLILTSAVVALGAVSPAHADERFFSAQSPTEYLAKDRMLGAKVYDDTGKIIGDIEDLIITNDGQVVGVIMGVGGFLGLGEKHVGVTKSALSLEATDGKIKVTFPGVDKAILQAAPAYGRIKPPKGWMQRAVEKGQELRDKSAVTAKDAYEAAKEKTAPMIEKAKEAAGSAVETAKEAAGTAVEKAKEAAQPAPATPTP